jgi:predicted ABC-type exoprotein transport system permease subunit
MLAVAREMMTSAEVGTKLALRFKPRIVLGSAPLVTFWAVGRFVDTQPAIGAAFLAAVIVFATARDSGIIKLMATMGFASVTVASLAGFILDSDKAFLINDVIFDFITVTASLVSIAIGKPLFRLIVHEMYPGLRHLVPEGHRVFTTLTIVLALHSITIGTTRAFLIESQSVGSYIVWSRVTSVTVNTIVIVIAVILMGRAVIQERREMARLEASA